MKPFAFPEKQDLSRVQMLELFAERYGLTLDQIRAKYPTKVARVARQEAMYSMARTGKWSSKEIAAVCGCGLAAYHSNMARYRRREGAPRVSQSKIHSIRGCMDGVRFGTLSVCGVKRNYVFCRLSGSVSLYRMNPSETQAVYDNRADRLKAARELLVHQIGLVT